MSMPNLDGAPGQTISGLGLTLTASPPHIKLPVVLPHYGCAIIAPRETTCFVEQRDIKEDLVLIVDFLDTDLRRVDFMVELGVWGPRSKGGSYRMLVMINSPTEDAAPNSISIPLPRIPDFELCNSGIKIRFWRVINLPEVPNRARCLQPEPDSVRRVTAGWLYHDNVGEPLATVNYAYASKTALRHVGFNIPTDVPSPALKTPVKDSPRQQTPSWHSDSTAFDEPATVSPSHTETIPNLLTPLQKYRQDLEARISYFRDVINEVQLAELEATESSLREKARNLGLVE